MASTYSDRLRIELIGTGEQSGTWGNTTNTNLGTLIEEAIAGVASITMTDANYTLTVADGSTDESRQAVLVMSGTLSTTRNVICPAEEKVYIIKNSTTGGQSIVLKTSGGTGITVPNGATMLVFCDGTNVLSGQDAAASWSVSGNATIGGTLTVDGATSLDDSVVINESGADKDFRVEGDTDTNLLFTDASADAVGIGTNTPGAKLNIVANTSGDAVRITQTGAGNALVVEDSTNPDSTPFVIDTNGKVLVGQTATWSAEGVLNTYAGYNSGTFINNAFAYNYVLTKSRSTTPGTKTIVQNGDQLGAIVWRGDDGAAYIDAAAIRADVDATPGTNDMPGRLVFSTTADGASSPTERMRIDNAGRIGIGSTTNAGTAVTVANNITGSVDSTAINSAGVIQSDATAAARYFKSTASTAAASFTTSRIDHFSATQGTFGSGSTVTNQYGFAANSSLTGATNNYGFYGNIASGTGRWNFYAAGTADNYFAGNVGIGAVPGVPLDVTANSGAIAYRVRGRSSDNIADIQFTDNAASTAYANIRTPAANTLSMLTAGSERMRIDSSGNVGIGTTSPTSELDIVGALSGGQILVSNNKTNAAEKYGTVGVTHYTNAEEPVIGLVVQSNSTDNIVILGGAVGEFNAATQVRFYTAANNTTTAGSERMRIDSSGRVGIKTSSPAVDLDVNGAVRVNAGASYQYYGASGGADQKIWDAYSANDSANTLFFRAVNDAYSASYTWLTVSRSGYQPQTITFSTGAGTERLSIDVNGFTKVTGSFGRGAPVTKTGNFTLAATENWIICNGTGSITVTLPAASSWTGRELTIKTVAAQTVVSASSNVVPLAGGSAGTAILAATAGKFATLVSDGTNWVIMAAN